MTSLVLINSPIQEYSEIYRPDYKTTAPIGLGYLGTIARNAGIDTELVDAEAEKLSIEETTRRVNSMCPRSVGINMSSTNYHLSLNILDRINAPHKIVGGPHASLMGERLTKQRPDLLVVSGEADDLIVDLVNNKRTGLVSGGLTQNLNKLPFIDRSLFVNDPYNADGRYEAAISTGRGCPFSCNFCSVPTMFGGIVRTRSVGNVTTEIRSLNKNGIDSIHFIDDIFNFNEDRLYEFCRELSGSNISWGCLSRSELLDNLKLKIMHRSGCYKISFGVESGVPRILNSIGKSMDIDHIRRIFAKCKDIGIETRAFFTIGHPTETEKEIRRTIDFAEELKPNDAYFMVVRAFPRTKLYAQMRNEGFTEQQLNQYQQFQGEGAYGKYHVTNIRSLNGMTNEHLDNLVKEAYSRFYKTPELVGV